MNSHRSAAPLHSAFARCDSAQRAIFRCSTPPRVDVPPRSGSHRSYAFQFLHIFFAARIWLLTLCGTRAQGTFDRREPPKDRYGRLAAPQWRVILLVGECRRTQSSHSNMVTRRGCARIDPCISHCAICTTGATERVRGGSGRAGPVLAVVPGHAAAGRSLRYAC